MKTNANEISKASDYINNNFLIIKFIVLNILKKN